MSIPRSSVCDLMKQVLTISEPFYVRELADLVTISAPTVKVWVEALEVEGLLTVVNRVKQPNGYEVPLYKRSGAFACKSN